MSPKVRKQLSKFVSTYTFKMVKPTWFGLATRFGCVTRKLVLTLQRSTVGNPGSGLKSRLLIDT